MQAFRGTLEKAYLPFKHLPPQFTSKIYDFVDQNIIGQKISTGEGYLEYLGDIVPRLSSLNLDYQTVTAGIIWNFLRLGDHSGKIVEELFGIEIAELSRRVEKLATLDYRAGEDIQAEKFRHLILALAQDIRVIFIRLVDRAHVLANVFRYPVDDPIKEALTARELFAPLANRLGIGKLKRELEDLSLSILMPDIYDDLKKRIDARREDSDIYLADIKTIIARRLQEENILNVTIKGRLKHIDSIYRKMNRQKISFDEVYDIIGIRVITESIKDCYSVLGIVHSLWKPIPKRFKDYIAVPKQNMYQSIHTSVIGPSANPLEIQIRTYEMDRISEVGIAAHWRYKENGTLHRDDQKFAWLRQVMEWMNDSKDPIEVMEMFRVDLFPDEVYVFTPKGDVRSLAKGATIVDFAFLIHTEIGLRCVGGKINGQMAPLRTILKNGDIVEVITGKSKGPSRDWLKFTQTTLAKNRIRRFLREQEKSQSIQMGRTTLIKCFRKHQFPIKKIMQSAKLLEVAIQFGYKTIDELFAAIGFCEISEQQVVNKFSLGLAQSPSESQYQRKHANPDSKSVKIGDMRDLMIRFARCCEPIPGEKIVGFITQGRGIAVHSASCPNIRKLDSNRIVPAEWEASDKPSYPIRILFHGYNVPSLVNDILKVFIENGIQILSQRINTQKKNRTKVSGEFCIEITELSTIETLISKLRNVTGVNYVARVLFR